MAQITQDELDEIIWFSIDHYAYTFKDYKVMYHILAQHAAYDTLIVVRNKQDEIIAVARWNILATGQDAVVLDVIIHPKWRRKGLQHRIVRKAKQMYPDLKYLIYERAEKKKPYKKVSIQRLLTRRF